MKATSTLSSRTRPPVIAIIVGVFALGFIVVAYRKTLIVDPEKQMSLCQTITAPAGRISCWRGELTQALSVGRVDSAFELLSKLYDEKAIAGDTCHDLTHQIGKSAYELFARGKRFPITAKTAYCSYGFYHGFMEQLVAKRGDMKVARDFCAYVDTQLARITPDVTLQCFHGIGHGTVNNHDPASWGDEQKLIDPALALCEEVSDTPERLSRCATGVFNGIAVFYGTGEYKLTPRKDDPLWICRRQKEQYKDACYISLNVMLLGISGGDLASAARFVEAIPEDSYAQHAMINLAGPVGTRNIDLVDHSPYIAVCRTLQPRLRLSCIEGYAYGFLEQGQPEKEYIKPLAFCGSNLLDKTEQKACFEYIFSYLGMWYSQEKVQSICQGVDLQYRALCLEKGTGVPVR